MRFKISDLVAVNMETLKAKDDVFDVEYADTGSVTAGIFGPAEYFESLRQAPSRARRVAMAGDTVYSTVRPNQRHFGFITNKLANRIYSTGFAVLHPNPEKVLPYYFYLIMNQEWVTEMLQSVGSGSTSAYPSIRPGDILNLEVEVPDLETQRRIVNIFQSLDGKMLVNNQINDNLLELGRSYYQNFVDTHDTEGQMVSTIAESVITGKTPSTKDESNYGDDVPFVTIPDMHSQIFTTKTTRSLSKKGADSQVKKYLPPFTLSVSSIGTPGLVTINPEESQTNQQINSVIAEKEKIWYLFLAFDSLKAHIENMGSGGSTILNLNKSNFEKIDIDWPIDKSALIEFNTVIEPIFMNILNNQREINSLSMVRDTLISELI